MKKLCTLFALTVWGSAAYAQVPTELQLKLQDTLQSMQLKYHYKGLSAAVSYKNAGIWKSAVGNSSSAVPLGTDMLIGIGSNTKTFVSVMMVKMQEEGLLSLDDTIGKWISGYEHINGQVTIRQLLNHTSGINSYTDNAFTWDSVNKDLSRVWTKEEILHKFVSTASFAPGKSWEYSNTNYIIAGLIEERVSGLPVYQLLRDRILAPNKLEHTFFPPYETTADPYAHLWTDWDGDGILDDVGSYGSAGLLPKEINSLADAAGALVSTPEDNVKFWKALMDGAIIKKTSVVNDLLRWSGFGGTSSDYGLGIFKDRYLGRTVFSHGGTWIGQINENLSDTASQIYITVISNQDSLRNDEVSKVVAALYKVTLDHQKLGISDAAPRNELFVVYPNPAKDQVYVRSGLPGEKTVRIYDLSGKLIIQLPPDPAGLISVSVSGLSPGHYIIEVACQQEKASLKLEVGE